MSKYEDIDILHKDMQQTYQFKTMNVLQHGQSVADTYEKIITTSQNKIGVGCNCTTACIC